MGYRICYYTRYEQQKKKRQTEVAAACEEVSNHARHVSCTHAHTQAFTSKSEGLKVRTSTTTKNQENIKQLMETTKARSSQPAWHSATPYPLEQQIMANNNNNTRPSQATPGKEEKTDNISSRLSNPQGLPDFQYTTPEAVLPIVFKVSALASRTDHPPAWASHTSNLLLPAPMESMPTPKPVK